MWCSSFMWQQHDWFSTACLKGGRKKNKKNNPLSVLNCPLDGGHVSSTFYLPLIWSLVTQLKSTKRISLRDAAEPPKNRQASRRAIWRSVVKRQAPPPCLHSPMCHSNRGRAPCSRAMFPSL